MTDEAKKLLRRTSDEIRATSDPSQSLMDLACDIDAFLSRPELVAQGAVGYLTEESWNRLRGWTISQILPGDGPEEAIDAAIDQAKEGK
jgi:hypothetical protein